jgi:hypothetical protein
MLQMKLFSLLVAVGAALIAAPFASESFTASGTITAARSSHTATLLCNGKVLIAGGFNGSYLNTAEIHDPAAGLALNW